MMTKAKVKSPTRNELADLVQEVGGADVILKILRAFYERMSKDTLIGFFFSGHDLDHISRMQGQFLLNAAGLVQTYSGRGPSTAHLTLPPILSGHFDRRLVLLKETLDSQGISEKNASLWIRFEESFRAIVVSD